MSPPKKALPPAIRFTAPPDQDSQQPASPLLELFDQGYEAIVMCGEPATGKSELVRGFTRGNMIYRARAQVDALALHRDMPIGGTNPGEVWYQIVAGRDKRVFFDPSGEFFTVLTPQFRSRMGLPPLRETEFEFMRRAVRHLAALILVFDLTRTHEDDVSPWRRQEDNFQFLLPALRWLRFEKRPRSNEMDPVLAIASRVGSLPRLDVPVLVAFTKADLLTDYTMQDPREFARRRLPVLHSALMTHTRRFRYDFCYTMVRWSAWGDKPVDRPCGVLLPMEWLLDPPFSWMPRIPTRLLEQR